MNQILFGTIMNNTGKVVCIEHHTNGYYNFIKGTTYTYSNIDESKISIVDYDREMHWITDRNKFITLEESRDMKLQNIIGDTADKKQP